ncbi:MAG TPA: gamma-glutamyltransferase [Gaiellaceae bacterium]|nr:gamma-glutamyltransferase [Gaiellaceae bacterium]
MGKRSFMLFTLALVVSASLAGSAPFASATPKPQQPGKQAVAIGTGGAAATVDQDATRSAIEVLRRGGNAVDAAVAAAATLGVTEPYVAGIGGGGFMVVYLADKHQVVTIDGRETAPQAFPEDAFIDPQTGTPIPFYPQRVTSGMAVGVPGTLATWAEAAKLYGTIPLARLLRPAIGIARHGFVVDQTYHDQTETNRPRLQAFTSSRALFLTGDGEAPAVGSVVRNPELAKTYEQIAQQGPHAFYGGPIGAAVVQTADHPPLAPDSQLGFPVRSGVMTADDVARYTAPLRVPTHVDYRGYDVYSMAPPSSGGSTVGEALDILEGFDLSAPDRALALHRYIEASRLAFADRNRWVGDPAYSDVPLDGLLSKDFAAERRCLIGPTAAASPVPPGDPHPPYDTTCSGGGAPSATPREGTSTNHLVVVDRHGDVVSYTTTIEQIAGSGIAVPRYGFLLNNELTDFNPVPSSPGTPDPNLPAGGKRPRSSMSPTIVLRDGRPFLALGSPGGATIITTVLQILLDRIDFGLSLPDAIAAPRASNLNSATTQAEPAFLSLYGGELTGRFGQRFTSTPQIGAATGIEFLANGQLQAAAEPARRGGGDAEVVCPAAGTHPHGGPRVHCSKAQ